MTLSFDLFDLEAGAEHCTCRAETSYQFIYYMPLFSPQEYYTLLHCAAVDSDVV